MVKWYLATYQNGVFSNDLGIIQPSEDYVYKLKNGIESTKSPEEKDWLRIGITDKTVKEWVTDPTTGNSSWTEDTTLTGLVNGSIYWVYGSIVKYVIVTNSQTYYLEDLTTLNDIGKTNITSITIGNSVETIGNDAFYRCTNLVLLNIGNSVKTIGYRAFYGCTSLASLNIPDSVTSIGIGAFSGCEKLASLNIGNSVTTIGGIAFSVCRSLASVTIGEKVETIGNQAFQDCSNLVSVNIPNSVTSIGTNAFDGINSNATITFESGIELTNFPGISSVSSLNTNDFTTTNDGLIINKHTNALLGVTSKEITNITIPDTVTSIGESAFYGCTSLTPTQGEASLIIPNLVTSIGEAAFYNCTSLTSLTIGNSVKTIGKSAFRNCSSLAEVNIPDSVTEIGYIAFSGINSNNDNEAIITISQTVLDKLGLNLTYNTGGQSFFGTDVTLIDPNFAYYTIVTNSQVYYLESFSNHHNEDTNTRIITGKDINDSDVRIDDLTAITAVTIGPSVTSIGNDAFRYCTSLKTVSIPDSVTSIGDDAFRHCTSLGSTEHPLIIPDSVETIGDYAFEHCYNLASLIIGKKVDTIGKYAFSYCTKLLTLNIPDSVENIGQYAFQGIGDSFNDDPIITISKTVLGNLNTKYNLELTHGTGQSFFGSPTSVTLQAPPPAST